MRTFNEGFIEAIINTDAVDIRYTIEVEWDEAGTELVYFLSHADSGAPDGATTIHSIHAISSTSQALNNRYAVAEIGALDFTLADVGNAITAELASRFEEGLTVVQKKCTIYMGTKDLDWADYEPVDTWLLKDLDHTGPGYKFGGSDIQRLMRQKIFTVHKSRLSASMTASQSHIPLTLPLSSTKFPAVVHDSGYTFNPSATVAYVKIDNEIIAHDGEFFNHGTDGPSVGVIQRGALNTKAAAHTTDQNANEDKGKEVTEVTYIEGKVVDLIHMVLTGGNVAGSATIPDHWNAGIDTDFIEADSFGNINTELAARRLRFIGEKDQDAKQFVEQQCMRFYGLYQTVTSLGKMKLNRYERTIQETAPVAYIDGHTLIAGSVGDLSQKAEDVINVYSINYNWDYLGERTTRSLGYLDASSYGSNGRLLKNETFEFRGVHTALHTDNDVRNCIYQTRELYSNPPFKTRCKVNRRLLGLEVGDVINLETTVRKDYVSGETTINRPFMVTRRSLDLGSGETSLELMGTGLEALAVIDPDAVGSLGELEDSFITGTGTNLEPLAQVTSGVVISNLTLTGTSNANDAASIWYIDHDLVIPSGVTLTLVNNVQLRATGEIVVQNGGKIDLKGRGRSGAAFGAGPATAGYFGTTKAGAGEQQAPDTFWYKTPNIGLIKTNDPAAVVGQVQTIPFYNLRNESGTLTGMPDDLRGTPGGPGGANGSPATGNGGNGGNSGAGFITISRGFTIEAGGIVDLSGNIGTSGVENDVSTPDGDIRFYAGGGAGGCPGGWLCIIDGDFSAPTSDQVTANRGNSPWSSPRSQNRTGFSVRDMAAAALRVQYVPTLKDIADDGTTGIRQLSAPTSLQLVSGDSTLLVKADGSIEERILATWIAATDSQVSGYQVQAKRSSDDDWITVGLTSGTDDLSIYINSEGGVEYDVRVRAFSSAHTLFVASEWATELNFEAQGKLDPPDDVPWFTIEGNTLKWGDVSDADLAGFQIRIRSGDDRQWNGASPIHIGYLPSSPYIAPSLPGGSNTLLIKAVDQSGNESENAAIIVTNIGDADFSNIVLTIDHHELGFPYDKVNGTVDGVSGDLEADESSDFYSEDEDDAFYSLDGAADFYPATLYAEMTYTWVHEVDQADIGADIALEYTISGVVSIFYRPYFSALFYTGIDSASVFTGDDNASVFGESQDWIAWSGLLTASSSVYEFMIVTDFGSTQGIISQLNVITDAPDIIEEFEDLAIGSSGTRLPISRTYREIKSVLLTLQSDGGSAANCKVLDKDIVSGPLVGCYNTSNALTSGTVDARIRGI